MEDIELIQKVLCPNVELSSSFGFVSVSIDCADLKRMWTKFQTFLPTETWSSPTWSCCLENNLRISLKVKKSCLLNPEEVSKHHHDQPENFQDRTRGFCYWITLAEAFLGKRLDVTDDTNIEELVNFYNMTLPELLGPGVLGYTDTNLLAQIVDHLLRGKILPEEFWGGNYRFTDCIPIIDGLKLAYWNASNDESEFMRLYTLASTAHDGYSVRTIKETFSIINNRTANIVYNGHVFATGYVDNVLLHEQVAIATRSLIEIMKKFVL